MKKYRKPVLVKKEQSRIHCGGCGMNSNWGTCGKDVSNNSQ